MEILFEDGQIVVCCKPVGLLSQADSQGGDSMVAQLGGAVFPVHRLDKAASGVMVYAKTAKAAAVLSHAVAAQEMEKEYLAVVRGAPSPAQGQWRDLLYHDVRKNKTFVVARPRKGVREAVLDYEVLQTVGDFSLVRVALQTGRTHQIRAQFAFHGHSLCGDRRYGGTDGALGLWSHRLAFLHPQTGKRMEFTLPPPAALPWELGQICVDAP